MQLGNVLNADSKSRSRLKLPQTVDAGLRAGLSLLLLLGPALSLAGLSQVKTPSPQAEAGSGIKVSVLNFQDESGTGATDELGRWLGSYLAKNLEHSSKQDISAQFFNWRNDASSIKDWPTKSLVTHGQKVRAQFVVRAGLLSASSDNLQGKVRTRIQLYAELVSVETANEVRVEARGVGYQRGEDSDATIAWDSIDFRSEEFGRSSVRSALADAIERLASEIDKAIRSFSSTNAEEGRRDPKIDQPRGRQAEQPIQPIPNDANADADSTPEAQEAVADEGVQQLLAQAQECLNSVNASREKLEALIQALQGLTSAIEQKASLLEAGRVTETGRVDDVIGAQSQGLQQAVDQILPEEPDAGSTGDAPVESGPGSSWFDRVTRAVDFGFSVFERVLDIRDRLRSFRGEPYPTDYSGGQPNGEQYVGEAPSEEPFVDVDGYVWQEDDATRGRLDGDDARPVGAPLRVGSAVGIRTPFAVSSPVEARLQYAIHASYSTTAGSRRSPVVGAEVIEPNSGASARTDSNGSYRLRVPAGSRRLIVRVGGTQVGERRISLAGGRAAADFVVRPNSRLGAAGAGRILPSRVVVNPDGSNTGTLGGLVQDAQGSPVPRALVEIGRLGRARTDSHGKFVFSKVPAGSHQITVRAGDLAPTSIQVRVKSNAPTETTIQLGSRSRSQGAGERLIAPGVGTVLRGVVTEGENRGLAGARLSIIGPSTSVSLRTGANGRFELKDLKPGTYRVLASNLGYADASQSVSLRPGSSDSVSFRMTQSNSRFDREVTARLVAAMGEVRGQVRGTDRRPIANATVELSTSAKSSRGDRVVTNERGEYALKALQGRYELRVLRQGYQAYSRPVDLQARDSVRADVELKTSSATGSGSGSGSGSGAKGEGRDGSLRGRVTDNQTNKGIADAKVSIGGISDATDATGHYQILNLGPGRHQVSISRTGYEGETGTVEVRAGSVTNRDFDLHTKSGSGSIAPRREGQLRGRVKDDRTDKGIPNVRVSVGGSSDTTDGGGNYQITSLQPGRHQVSITGNGYEGETGTVEVRAGSVTNRDFDLHAKSGSGSIAPRREGELRGRVTDDRTDKGIPNVRVSAGGSSDTTDGGGTYQITSLQPGRHQVSISRTGYEGKTETVDVRAGSATNRNFELRTKSGSGGVAPRREGQLRGRVTDDRTRKPISGARVSVQGRTDTTDHAGNYLISAVPAGRYSVTVTRSGYSGESASVEVKAGGSTTRNVELRSVASHTRDSTVNRNPGATVNRNTRNEKPPARPRP
jgi:hypothetical protein